MSHGRDTGRGVCAEGASSLWGIVLRRPPLWLSGWNCVLHWYSNCKNESSLVDRAVADMPCVAFYHPLVCRAYPPVPRACHTSPLPGGHCGCRGPQSALCASTLRPVGPLPPPPPLLPPSLRLSSPIRPGCLGWLSCCARVGPSPTLAPPSSPPSCVDSPRPTTFGGVHPDAAAVTGATRPPARLPPPPAAPPWCLRVRGGIAWSGGDGGRRVGGGAAELRRPVPPADRL